MELHCGRSETESSPKRTELLSSMVLSPSGWRAVFGGTDGSMDPALTPEYRDIVAVAASTYARFLKVQSGKDRPIVVVGTDTRPTGPAIADTALRVFLHHQLKPRWLGQTATPEIISYTGETHDCDGMFYISASHNPPGHNGLKLALSDGSIIPGPMVQPLIDTFRTRCRDDKDVAELVSAIIAVSPRALNLLYDSRNTWKDRSLRVYSDFSLAVAVAPEEKTPGRRQEFLQEISQRLSRRPLGFVGELNGSARCTSIDRSFLPDLGVRTALHNDIPGTFSHQILPEGVGLDEATALLERYHRIDPSYRVAYVPDNDGDRGNLVFYDDHRGCIALDAQTVFALVVTIQLAWHRHLGFSAENTAVVANGPTSLRIERICRRFGATLFRAEVGEANVVSLSRALRAKGWTVAILGEGSNGGNITPPATVRDPMSTLLALIKLHAYNLAAYWDSNLSGEADFMDLVDSLPSFLTVETDNSRAKMQIPHISHRDLKRNYEDRLPETIVPLLKVLGTKYAGPISYRLVNYEGTETTEGPGNRQGLETGGLKVLFSDSSGLDIASVWMRGSGTEPLFRILADCEGTHFDILNELIEWQRREVAKAAGVF